MLAIFKVLIGVAGIGAGVGVPFVVNKMVSSSGEVVTHIAKIIKQEMVESKENAKLLEALKDLQGKNCKLVQNANNPHNSFESIYACSENNTFNFYYLGKRDDVKKNGVSEVKKIKTLNYEKDNNNQVIALTLENKDSSSSTTVVKMSVADQDQGGWARFKSVDLSSKCKIATPKLGSDVLECTLTEGDNS